MKMNEMEKNLDALEKVNGGDIYEAIENYNRREQMRKDFLADERRRFTEMLKNRRDWE